MTVYSGAIVTCDEANTVYKYLIEDKGRIIFTGNVLPDKYANAELCELGEKAMLPTFVDTHAHYSSFALFYFQLMLYSYSSNEEILEAISKKINEQRGKLLLGYGLSAHAVKERTVLSRTQIDKAAGDTPVFLVKYDGHSCVVNTPVLKKLPKHIRKLRGYNEDTGIMSHEAFFEVSSYISNSISPLKLMKSLIDAYDYLAANGFGMVHTVSGVGFPLDADVDLERLMARGIGTGLQTRVFFQTMDIAKVKRRKLPRIGGCFATALDGCFGSLDAALHQPYERSENTGILFYSDEEVMHFCSEAHNAGLQIQMHAIGDAAFDQAAKSLSAVIAANPRENHRHGIIHAPLPTDRGMDLCAEYGIQIPVQPAFIDWPQEPTEYLVSILGDREAKLNPLKTFQKRGILISGGSDAPVTAPDAINGIYKACNHTQSGESLTIEEAVKLFTVNGYKATFDENERGTLEPGKIADMIILSGNPYEYKPSELNKLHVEKTFFKGRGYRKPKAHVFPTAVKGLFSSELV